MAQSYMLVLLDGGRVHAQERRLFKDLPPSEYSRQLITQYLDGSIKDNDAVLLVNRWNMKAVQEAVTAGLPLRFVYYL